MARLSHPEAYDPGDRRMGMAKWEYDAYAAIYDNARRFHEAWWKAMPKVTEQPVAATPYGWPAYGFGYPPVVAATPLKAEK